MQRDNPCFEKQCERWGRGRWLLLFLLVALEGSNSFVSAQAGNFGESLQYFPHFAVGAGWTTLFTIHNPTLSAATVKLELYRSDSSLLVSQDLLLAPRATQTVKLEEQTSTITTGWAKFSSEGRFNATELFQSTDAAGQLLSQVGVLPSVASQEFGLFAFVDLQRSTKTGVALANPSATSESVLTVRRLNTAGQLLDTRTIRLGPLHHAAGFLHEDPYFAGVDNFEGVLEFSADNPVAAVTLRLEGTQLASVGVITPQGTALTEGSVTTLHLASAAVTTPKLANGAVTAAKLADGAVTNAKLAAGAVTNAKIADGTITAGKLASAQVVKSINALKDDVTLAAGANVAITRSGNILTIASTGGGTGGLTLPFQGSISSASNAFAVRHAGAAGIAGDFSINNTANNSPALFASTTGTGDAVAAQTAGTGNAGDFSIQNTGNSSAALFALTLGTGRAGDFLINNATNSSAALFARTHGTGRAGDFEITNSANPRPALFARTHGTGDALAAQTTGTGKAGDFFINNTTNSSPVLRATTNGTGDAGNFSITNMANSSSALLAITLGTGIAGNFGIINSANTSPALFALTNGTGDAVAAQTTGAGNAGDFSIQNTANRSAALFALTFGTGSAGNFSIQNTANSSAALFATTNGTGSAGNFQTTNTGNPNAALVANTNGRGAAVAAAATGSAPAGVFEIKNPDSPAPALQAITNSGNPAIEAIALGTGRAGNFIGDVFVSGRLIAAGGLGTTFGSSQIDHPLDPANKYLSRSFVESPDMMNIYNGNVTLDAMGEAQVELPDWFEALNRDFRYQLTAIGAPGPHLYVAEEIAGNRFKIVGGQPGGRVSWQVTGIRQDAFANAHRIRVEEEKPLAERGYYLHPELYGQPETKSVGWARNPHAMEHIGER